VVKRKIRKNMCII